MPTVEQIRAARALLGWNQKELADRAGLSQTGIARIENGTHQPNSATEKKIVTALCSEGLDFIDGGVRRIQDRLLVFDGADCLRKLQDDIYNTLRKTKGEVLLLGISEIDPEEREDYAYTKGQIKRLMDAGASERILVRDDEKNFIAPLHWYRLTPEKYFSPHTVYVYETKIALLLRAPHYKVLLLDNPYFAETLRTFFNFVWDNAAEVPK